MTTSLRTAIWIVMVAIAPGCLWANKSSQTTGGVGATALIRDDGAPTGAVANVNVTIAGLGVGFELGAKSIPITDPPPGDDRTFVDLNAALMLRASPLAILATDHKLERWFDFGVEAGIGGGAVAWASDKWSGQAMGFVGGYVDIGTVGLAPGAHDDAGDRRYVALVGTVRAIQHDESWGDEVVIGVGVALRVRGPMGTMPHD